MVKAWPPLKPADQPGGEGVLPIGSRVQRGLVGMMFCLCSCSDEFVDGATFHCPGVPEPGGPPAEPVGGGLGGIGLIFDQLVGKAFQGLGHYLEVG